MATLSELREQIDGIDSEIVALLRRRADLVLGVKAAKSRDHIDIYSPAREAIIIDRVRQLAAGGNFPLASLEKVFRAIISATRSLIGELSIAFVGPACSLANQAALKQFGEDVRLDPVSAVEDVFDRVERGESAYGVVPVEMGTQGLIVETFEAFIRSPLKAIAEVCVDEKLVAASRADSAAGIRRVISDVGSFSRAARWLSVNFPGVDQVLVESAWHAVDQAQRDESCAAIVPSFAAEQRNMHIIATGVQDRVSAHARFFVIGPQPALATGQDRTTLISVVKDRAGALKDLLAPFAEHGLTLTKIESKPMRHEDWEYAFVIDFLGHAGDAHVAAALDRVRGQSFFYRLLGSYPAAGSGSV